MQKGACSTLWDQNSELHQLCHGLCSMSIRLPPSGLWFLFVCHGSLYPMTSLSHFAPHDLLIFSSCFYQDPYDIAIATTYSWGTGEWHHCWCVLYDTRLMWPLVKSISSCSVRTPKPQLGVPQLSPLWTPPCSFPLLSDLLLKWCFYYLCFASKHTPRRCVDTTRAPLVT